MEASFSLKPATWQGQCWSTSRGPAAPKDFSAETTGLTLAENRILASDPLAVGESTSN
ncbi:hypothetical protein [Corynebacterium alimapuense]|uniref:hypothetical protein n=1 Tax=Corynebacterium alimapuense TaxID=1576874 RepID=UPI00140414EB|nr:hypothetical protein [Corynebacterium alimapuense]